MSTGKIQKNIYVVSRVNVLADEQARYCLRGLSPIELWPFYSFRPSEKTQNLSHFFPTEIFWPFLCDFSTILLHLIRYFLVFLCDFTISRFLA